MEIQVAASSIGKKRFYIDLTNWDRVERRYRPFLVNSGWPGGLASSVVDITSYMEEVARLYREAVEAIGSAERSFVKAVAKMWPWRFIVPSRFEIDASALGEVRGYWEIKTHVESVLGKKFGRWGEVYTAKVKMEARGGAVYVGDAPSLGHTYLLLLGVLSL
ncbi:MULTISPECIES: hypothetical protein [Pyrobaculum]|uniref:Uncharacterized protein n=2 Tax=Pyrobaculum arsenaticum TaxID=121277 RepID=A4WH43_PYRAR|nr:hypothetical protein [Pyrobaculum arsenaticum]ABP49710.1 conserved hypothetical protein [Pyrobaculum arsenaticum DSM 13514]MCY0890856.1 hypothetical protein [Pyrobaculum arsenaticum]NYR15696.1 hypothetical protein [Pyrobaculum arsenaticum]